MFVYYLLVISITNIYHSFNVQIGMLAMKVLNNWNDIIKDLLITNLVFQLLRGKNRNRKKNRKGTMTNVWNKISEKHRDD